MDFPYRTALIVGAGVGISASLARRLSARGSKVGLAARDVQKLAALSEETGAATFSADTSQPQAVAEAPHGWPMGCFNGDDACRTSTPPGRIVPQP